MSSRFINREVEIDYLNQRFHQEKSSLVVIFGRRRIGKTTLIKQFISGKISLDFMATEEPVFLQENDSCYRNQS